MESKSMPYLYKTMATVALVHFFEILAMCIPSLPLNVARVVDRALYI
jgi:hypothetical protein